MSTDLSKMLLLTNPDLSRFNPLPRLLCYDDFDRGLQGWTSLIGNYEDSLDAMLPEYHDLRGPMLSNVTVWDTGTDGSYSGNYAMKLATRPRAGSLAVAIKRLTFRHVGPICLETYFTFKPEASELRLSETDVRAAGFLFDLQETDMKSPAPVRVMPHIRYLNAMQGEAVATWQYKADREAMQKIGETGKTKSHFHLGPEGWSHIPGAQQLLCYNEIATKQNWHYLRMDFDLAEMQYMHLQCNDRVFDVSTVKPMQIEAMANLWCMLNLVFFVETDTDKRAFLYIDSILLSGQEA